LTLVHKSGRFAGSYEHQLANGRSAVAIWLYEGNDATRRTIMLREWNNPDIRHRGAASL
jgi:hypothetical protein